MLLGKTWLKDAKVAHDWGNNTVTIQGNGMIRTIVVAKHLGAKVKKSKVLLCQDSYNGIIDEEEDIIFVIKPKLFSLGTISLPDTFQFIGTTQSNHRFTRAKNHSIELNNTQSILVDGETMNGYSPIVALQEKYISKNVL